MYCKNGRALHEEQRFSWQAESLRLCLPSTGCWRPRQRYFVRIKNSVTVAELRVWNHGERYVCAGSCSTCCTSDIHATQHAVAVRRFFIFLHAALVQRAHRASTDKFGFTVEATVTFGIVPDATTHQAQGRVAKARDDTAAQAFVPKKRYVGCHCSCWNVHARPAPFRYCNRTPDDSACAVGT